MRRLYSVWAILLPLFPAAQQAMHPGDNVPSTFLAQLPSYDQDKLVILDFWATWCTSCLREFPREDTMQQKLGDRLQVFLIDAASTGDDSAKVNNYYKKWSVNHGKPLTLIPVIQDRIFTALFPHVSIPHYVWLYHGRVLAVTGPEDVKESTVRTLLAGKHVAWNAKDDSLTYDRHLPLFVHGPGSMYSGFRDGLPVAVTVDRVKDKVTRICLTNTNLADIFMYALDTFLPRNRFVGLGKALETPYCYELVTEPVSEKKAYKKMLKDLEKIFHVHATLAVFPTHCLVLSGKYAGKLDTTQQDNNLADPAVSKYIHNEPLSALIDWSNNRLVLPLVDETVTGIVSIDNLPADITDTEAFGKTLASYGLTLSRQTRRLTRLVFYH